MKNAGVGAAEAVRRHLSASQENQEALSVVKRALCRDAARGSSPNMNDDDSGDEAEARHLLEKRREQAKYDAVRSDSDRTVARERRAALVI